ncbi:MAG: hypothetical protein PHI71_02030 [Acidiphilium sp.]|nr:hypothetical protein [Acidiphilium sp.]
MSGAGFSSSKSFFFVNKKEAKKTLLIWVRAGETARALSEQKFFASFLQKRSLSFRPFAAFHSVPKGF